MSSPYRTPRRPSPVGYGRERERREDGRHGGHKVRPGGVALPLHRKEEANMRPEMGDPNGKPGTVSFSLPCKCVAEFIGCAVFVFAGTSQWSVGDIVVPALAHGLAIFILITSLGHISGGHFNPVVTLSVVLCRRLRPLRGVCFVLCQLAGGVIGALLTRGILTTPDYNHILGGAPSLSSSYSWANGLLAEIIASFFLVHTILLTAVDDTKWHAALAIGLTIAVDILCIGHITGGVMNPARALGPALVWQIFDASNGLSDIWTYHFIYWIGPFVGALLATGVYMVCYSREHRLLK